MSKPDLFGRMEMPVPAPAQDAEQIAKRMEAQAAVRANDDRANLATEVFVALNRMHQLMCKAREFRPQSDFAKLKFSAALLRLLRERGGVMRKGDDLALLQSIGVEL